MSVKNDLEPNELRKLRPSACLTTPGSIEEIAEAGSELAGNLASAACLTFEDAEVSPQEVLTVYEAIKQCLELSIETDPAQKLAKSIDEAFDLTASLLGKDINPAIVAWIGEWTALVKREAGIKVFMQHLDSVAKQYAVIMSLKYR